MSKLRWGKRVLKGTFRAGRLRERYALNTPKKKTAAKAFGAGAGGSLAGSYLYDRIKEKKDKMRG